MSQDVTDFSLVPDPAQKLEARQVFTFWVLYCSDQQNEFNVLPVNGINYFSNVSIINDKFMHISVIQNNMLMNIKGATECHGQVVNVSIYIQKIPLLKFQPRDSLSQLRLLSFCSV
jgi:hypothetical protein